MMRPREGRMATFANVNQPGTEIVISPQDILFECPSCGKSLVVDEAAQGLTVECPKCHINVIVPPKERASAPAATAPTPARSSAPVEAKPEAALSPDARRAEELRQRLAGVSQQLKELQTQRTELSNRIAARTNDMNRDLVLLARLDTSQQQVLSELNQLLQQILQSAKPGEEPPPAVVGSSVNGRTRVSFR